MSVPSTLVRRYDESDEQRRTLTLQNEFLQIRILPAFGGKISSLRSARTGEEFLLRRSVVTVMSLAQPAFTKEI